MRRFGPLFWIALALITGIANYAVKHWVQGLDDELTAVRRKIVAEQKEIHTLTASWTYLNQPDLLADQNKRFIGLAAVTPKQLERGIDDLPWRPEPVAPPQPELQAQTVAAVSPAPAATAVAPSAPSASVPAPPASAPAASAPPATRPAATVAAARSAKPQPPQRLASLDALFARVAGSR